MLNLFRSKDGEFFKTNRDPRKGVENEYAVILGKGTREFLTAVPTA